MGAITFVTGGARSGKSNFAESIAANSGEPVVYLATMEPADDELRTRIRRHRERRPTAWRTLEVPVAVPAAIEAVDSAATVLLDCLSLWVSNLFFSALPVDDAPTSAWEDLVDFCLSSVDRLVAAQDDRAGHLIVVSNEVGMGIVPGDPLSRWYRDALGLANQRLASDARRAVLMISGRAMELGPSLPFS
ncbi:MAG: bifunctional adenosylcobinamide kinase/adenosylcobinamide-phosphate guanylyltransferase [Dehalococcoidia bacterium]